MGRLYKRPTMDSCRYVEPLHYAIGPVNFRVLLVSTTVNETDIRIDLSIQRSVQRTVYMGEDTDRMADATGDKLKMIYEPSANTEMTQRDTAEQETSKQARARDDITGHRMGITS